MQAVMYSRYTRLRESEDGVGTIEFALGAVLVMTMIFGIMDGSRALYADHYVSNAARSATRYAMVRGASWNGASCSTTGTYSCTATPTDVTNYVKSVTPLGFTADNLAVNTIWSGKTPNGEDCSSVNANKSPGCVVSVEVDYSFNFVLPLLPKDTLVLKSTSAVAIAQ